MKTSLYAYLKAKIPVPLVGRLCVIPVPAEDSSTQAEHAAVDQDNGNPSVEDGIGISVSEYGSHSVVITGYRSGTGNDPASNPINAYPCQACSINKVYAHDDAVGPFARMELDGTKVSGLPGEDDLFSLSTSYRPRDLKGEMRFVPKTLLVPLYHKIRIPFDTVREVVTDFQALVSGAAEKGMVKAESLLWDVYLTTVNDYKQEIRKNYRLTAEERLKILRMSLPRFLCARRRHVLTASLLICSWMQPTSSKDIASFGLSKLTGDWHSFLLVSLAALNRFGAIRRVGQSFAISSPMLCRQFRAATITSFDLAGFTLRAFL